MNSRVGALAGAVALVGVSSAVGGGPCRADSLHAIPPIQLVFEVEGCPIDIDAWTCGEVIPLPDGTFRFRGEHSIDDLATVRWSIVYDPDPLVVAQFVVTNSTAVLQTYQLVVQLPVDIERPALAGGTFIGTVCDGMGDGATVLAPADGAIVTALANGQPFPGGTLFPAPFAFHVGPFECQPLGPEEFGTPIPSLPLPGPIQSIGIAVTLQLSPRDSLACFGVLVVEP